MDDVGYGALAAALTLVGGVYTYYAYQKRGAGAGLKGAGLTLLPIAAYLTQTLEMFGRIADAIGDWATRLVFSPVVWVGLVVAGIGALLFAAGRVVERRGGEAASPRQKKQTGAPEALPPARRDPNAPTVDDDLADIEALLKNRGIT